MTIALRASRNFSTQMATAGLSSIGSRSPSDIRQLCVVAQVHDGLLIAVVLIRQPVQCVADVHDVQPDQLGHAVCYSRRGIFYDEVRDLRGVAIHVSSPE